MQRYIITERGKLLIAILIIFVLFLTALILVIWLLTRDISTEIPVIGSSDLPQNSLGLSASESTPEIPYDSPQVSPGGDCNGSLSPDSSLAGPIAFDLDAGLLTFLFTPDTQDALGEDTVSMIGELLKSPKNVNGAMIAVEIPLLSDDETAMLTTAVTDVFEEYNVPLGYVIFLVYQPEPYLKTFTVSISFR